MSKKIITRKFLISNHYNAYKKLSFLSRQVNIVWNECVRFQEDVYQKNKVNSRLVDPSFVDLNSFYKKDKKKEKKIKSTLQAMKTPIVINRPGKPTFTVYARSGRLDTFDFINFSSGTSEYIPLSSKSINMVAEEVAKSYKEKTKRIGEGKIAFKAKHTFVNLRGRKNPGWIPFYLKQQSGFVLNLEKKTISAHFKKHNFKIKLKLHTDKQELDGIPLSGNLIQDRSGKWYACVSFEVLEYPKSEKGHGKEVIGIDLGMSTTATTSNGIKVEVPEYSIVRFGKSIDIEKMKSIYQSVESKERASASFNNRAKLNFNNKIKKLKENLIYWESQKDSIKKTIKIKSLSKKIKKMHSFLKEPDKVNWKKIDKIKNKINKLERKQNDKQNHLFYNKAHEIIDTSCLIKVGDVSGKLLQKLGGKSAKKASIGKFKDKLKWIGLKREVPVIIVNEAHSTVTCSKCKEKTGPTGIKMLNVRYWTCSKCDSVHDRDINASINIKEKEILVS